MGTKIVLAASDFQLTEVLTRILVPDNSGLGGGVTVDPCWEPDYNVVKPDVTSFGAIRCSMSYFNLISILLTFFFVRAPYLF